MAAVKLPFTLFLSRDRLVTFIFFPFFMILSDIRYLGHSTWHLFPSFELESNFAYDTVKLVSFFDL